LKSLIDKKFACCALLKGKKGALGMGARAMLISTMRRERLRCLDMALNQATNVDVYD